MLPKQLILEEKFEVGGFGRLRVERRIDEEPMGVVHVREVGRGDWGQQEAGGLAKEHCYYGSIFRIAGEL